jgi:DNA-binding NtrC family response regulator
MNAGQSSEPRTTILILSAEPTIPEQFPAWAREAGHRCVLVVDERLREGYTEFDDLSFEESPDCLAVYAAHIDEGIERAIRVLRLEYPDLGILLIGANGAPQDSAHALQAGADIFLEHTVSRDRFVFTLSRLFELQQLRSELGYLRRRDATGAALGGLVGNCPQMREVFNQVVTLCRRSAQVRMPPPVLITGETGTGKGQIARAIHYNGLRRDQALVEVNCASLPPSLIEAELFGNERGAYTGALTTRAGLIEVAHKGSILLDDIATLDLDLQAKLLRFLDDRTVRRLGSNTERFVDVQFIAATHRDLEAAVDIHEFREDLYYRLGVVKIHLPPLRDRGDDVVDLATAFLEERCGAYGMPVKKLAGATRDAMRRYTWPGNIRELRNRLEQIVLLQDSQVIEPQHLDLPTGAARVVAGGGQVQVEFPPDGIQLDQVVQSLIDHALEVSQGNLSKAARLLGISRAALRYRLGR